MSAASALFGDVDMTKVMWGERARHVPLNLIVQRVDNTTGKVTGVFQTDAGLPLMYDSKRTHVLILGDAVIRPRLAMGSDAFVGWGIAGLARDGFAEIQKWVDTGDLLLPPLGR